MNAEREGKEKARFVISNQGVPILQFESEVHIRDSNNEDVTIVVKSGHSELEPTIEYANKLIAILNGKNRGHIEA